MKYLQGILYYLPISLISEVKTESGTRLFWFQEELLPSLQRFHGEETAMIIAEDQLLQRLWMPKPEPRLVAVGPPGRLFKSCLLCDDPEALKGERCPMEGAVWHLRLMIERGAA